MYQHYEQWNETAKKMQEPFQAMTELNIRTLQSVEYLKPEELVHFKNPEDLMQKQLQLAVNNSHKALEYMQKSFQIFEKAMCNWKAATEMKK